MTDPRPDAIAQRSVQTLRLLRASHMTVSAGANLNDPLGIADDLMPEDVYRVSTMARVEPMRVLVRAKPPFEIARDSETGMPGAALHLDSRVTLMAADGSTAEALILVETDAQDDVAGVWVLPIAPLQPRSEYVLVSVDRDRALDCFAQVACASFTRGTRIALATGAQVPVEALRPGDRILTRDDGPQPLRWIGQRTTRATGLFAPVLIRAGTLNNSGDLVVSPDHRLFIYQRADRLGAGRAELMVKARHLVNGASIVTLEGGHVDYFHMLFDHHQIVYAEGIAAESTLLDTASRALLPDEIAPELLALLPAHRRSDYRAIEVQESLLNRPDAADLLRKSSLG